MRSINPSQSAAIQNRGPIASSSGNELPIIQQSDQILVDARLLHQKLKVGKDFSTWIKDRIEKYRFEEGMDYSPNLGNRSDGKPGKGRIEYHLTLDMAKELAMLEENETGRKIRKYFIEVEKKARATTHLPKEPELFTGLKPLQLNSRTMYPYMEIVARCGYSKRASSSRRREAYWMHFVKWGNLLYITTEYCLQLYHQKRVAINRPALRAMTPVIPANFGDTSQLRLFS
jgi:phage anti-repressor protein